MLFVGTLSLLEPFPDIQLCQKWYHMIQQGIFLRTVKSATNSTNGCNSSSNDIISKSAEAEIGKTPATTMTTMATTRLRQDY
jgi:hypothetical protein